MKLRKKIRKFFKSLKCSIAGHDFYNVFIAEGKYKARSSKGSYRLLFNIYEYIKCQNCGKIQMKRKVRSNLNQEQARHYLNQNIDE